MVGCNLERLVRLLDNKLNLNARLEAFDHLDKCKDCRETIYHLSRSRDEAFFIFRKNRPILSVA